MGDHRIDGYFDFVVPPLEGFWWQPGVAGVDYADKAAFRWISAIRLPDFVTPEEFAWAQAEAARKKGQSASTTLTISATSPLKQDSEQEILLLSMVYAVIVLTNYLQ